jgi:hypothetical protein
MWVAYYNQRAIAAAFTAVYSEHYLYRDFQFSIPQPIILKPLILEPIITKPLMGVNLKFQNL